MAVARVDRLAGAASERQPLVTERDQVLADEPSCVQVVAADDRAGGRLDVGPDQDHGQAGGRGCREQAVLAPRVTDEDQTVYAPFGDPGRDRARIVSAVEHQTVEQDALAAVAELFLNACEDLRKPRALRTRGDHADAAGPAGHEALCRD